MSISESDSSSESESESESASESESEEEHDPPGCGCNVLYMQSHYAPPRPYYDGLAVVSPCVYLDANFNYVECRSTCVFVWLGDNINGFWSPPTSCS